LVDLGRAHPLGAPVGLLSFPQRWQRWLGPFSLAIALMVAAPAQGQVLRPEIRFPFLADPLQDDPLDPLLPTPVVERPLSPLEQYALEQDLDQLALETAALDAAGEFEQARLAWQREIRLRRLLGIDQELAAIDRVGQVLRDRNATQDLQLYAVRMDEIRAELSLSEDRERLESMADTYVVLGAVDSAAEIYRDLADLAQASGDGDDQRQQLEILATLHADWFEFIPAAEVYSELVDLAQASGDGDGELGYLEQQANNLEQAQDFAGAIALRQQLLTLYQTDPTLWPQIAPLQYQVAGNYRALGDLDTAARQYQTTYTNAIEQEQLAVAAVAIADLADIYKGLNRWEDVGYLYEQLLLVEQQAHNAFGMMAAYDQLGQVHEQLGVTPSALAAYREGLVLARVLGTRQTYFETQIARLTGEASEW
jgi:tetratricopeptide (TPR) repeat protein